MLNKIYYSFRKNNLSRPINLIYFVTNNCNAKCSHCFYFEQMSKKKNEDLTLNEIEDFSKQLGKLIWLSLSGGEPYLREDVNRIYEIFIDNNKVEDFSIPTNGILPQVIYNKTKQMLESRNVKSFNFNLSLDGTKEIHNSIRGINCYDNVLKTYDKIITLKKDYPNLLVKINTVLSNKNIDDLSNLHKEVKKNMPDLDFHNFEILRGAPRDSKYKTPTTDQLKKIRNTIFDIWKNYHFYGKNKLKSRIAFNAKKQLFNTYIQILETKKQPFRCYAGTIHCVLDYNGDIYLCELLDKIGNIRKQSFKEIWDSKKAKSYRKMIENKGCYCTHSCFQNTNMIFNHKYWFKFIK